MQVKTCSNKDCPNVNPQPIENFHIDHHKKDGYRSRCKTCELNRAKQYREANRQMLAEKQRDYYSQNGETQRNASNRWKRENKAHVSQYAARWAADHRAERSVYNHDYGQANHDRVLERSRKRRAISYGKSAFFTEEEFQAKFESLGCKCFYCKKPLAFSEATRDHYVPLTKGGNDSIDNIVPACANCNSHKRNKMPDEFISALGNHEPSRTNGDK